MRMMTDFDQDGYSVGRSPLGKARTHDYHDPSDYETHLQRFLWRGNTAFKSLYGQKSNVPVAVRADRHIMRHGILDYTRPVMTFFPASEEATPSYPARSQAGAYRLVEVLAHPVQTTMFGTFDSDFINGLVLTAGDGSVLTELVVTAEYERRQDELAEYFMSHMVSHRHAVLPHARNILFNHTIKALDFDDICRMREPGYWRSGHSSYSVQSMIKNQVGFDIPRKLKGSILANLPHDNEEMLTVRDVINVKYEEALLTSENTRGRWYSAPLSHFMLMASRFAGNATEHLNNPFDPSALIGGNSSQTHIRIGAGLRAIINLDTFAHNVKTPLSLSDIQSPEYLQRLVNQSTFDRVRDDVIEQVWSEPIKVGHVVVPVTPSRITPLDSLDELY